MPRRIFRHFNALFPVVLVLLFEKTSAQTWTSKNCGTATWLQAITWNGTNLCAVGMNGLVGLSQDKGRTWSLYRAAFLGSNLNAVTWTGSRYIAVGDSGRIVSSPDGVTWTLHANPAGIDSRLTGVCWTGDRAVAVGYQGVIPTSGVLMTSLDGITWTKQADSPKGLKGIARAGNLVIAVGFEGYLASAAPTNLSVWTARNSGITTELEAVAWTGSRFVAVGNLGAILTSADGISWAKQVSGVTELLKSVTWTGSEAIAVGFYGTVLRSRDGVSWRRDLLSTAIWFFGVTWAGDQAFSVGENGMVFTYVPGPASISSRSIRQHDYRTDSPSGIVLNQNRRSLDLHANGAYSVLGKRVSFLSYSPDPAPNRCPPGKYIVRQE